MSNPFASTSKRPVFSQRLIVGVAVDAINNYGRLILQGIHKYANARREWLLHEKTRVNEMRSKDWPVCDGAIFAAVPGEVIERLSAKSRVSVSCSSSTHPDQMPVVAPDNHAIGRLAAEHLIERRLKNFAYYGALDSTGSERQAGFEAALKRLGYTCYTCPNSMNEGKMWDYRHWPILHAWLDSLPKPIGVFTRDDPLASMLAASCLHGGLIVPDQVSIIGVNNDTIICEGSWPPLSSVEVDFVRIGYLAASQLDLRLSGEAINGPDRYHLIEPTSAIARLSTDIHLVDDTDLATAMAYIREHARTGCSVSDLLKVVPVSRSWLERQFREKLGRTPHDEIIRVRMEHARRLLVDTEESISRISERCGYHVVQNFNRAFTQRVGISPFAFRKSHRHT